MEILDNTEGKRLVDSLRANLDDEDVYSRHGTGRGGAGV